MEFKQSNRRTYDRNVASGKWLPVGSISVRDGVELGALIKTAHKTRGVSNGAGRVFYIEFHN